MKPENSRTAAVIVVSTSAAKDASQDLTGSTISEWLKHQGFTVAEPIRVSDGAPFGQALQLELERHHEVVLTTGGTGVSPDDLTPEITKPLLDIEIPGLFEALRSLGRQHTPFASLTRGIAGFSGPTFLMNLPGSASGVRDGLKILEPVLPHLLEQRAHGGGHPPRTATGTSKEFESEMPNQGG